MPVEADLQKKCINHCKALNILAYKVEAASQRGFPDLLLVFPHGHVTFCELKSPKGTGKLSPWQIRVRQQLRNNNADIFTTDSFAQFIDAVAGRLDP